MTFLEILKISGLQSFLLCDDLKLDDAELYFNLVQLLIKVSFIPYSSKEAPDFAGNNNCSLRLHDAQSEGRIFR